MIKLAEQTISQGELERLAEWVVGNHQLTKGPLTLEFEAEFARWSGSKYAVFVNSGSSANLLIAQALRESGYLKNNRVLVPAVSWVTTVTPFLQLGFDVKLCDCASDDLGLDVDHLERLVAEFDPGLIVVVDVLGHSNKFDEILDICERRKIRLIEDSCEALGSVSQSRKLGRFGLAGSFSFYYGHHISTIEGGMVITDDPDLWNVMKSIRSHGWGRDVEPGVVDNWKSAEIDDFRDLYTFYFSGFNLRATDLQAFLGLSQLKKIDEIVDARRINFEQYASNLPEFFSQKSDTDIVSSFAYGTLVTNPQEVAEHMLSRGIETRPLICGNIGLHPFWVRKFGESRHKNADLVHENDSLYCSLRQ